MNPICALLVLFLSQATVLTGPSYPPNAVAGANVVGVLHFSSGAVRNIDVLSGEAPFVEPAAAALSGWKLGNTANNDVLVVVNYRTPTLYSVGSGSLEVAQVKASPGLAYPRTVIEPRYPPNLLAEGSVVLKLALSESGSVTKISVVQGLGGMTEACVAAASQWKFNPARNRQNAVIASEAYAVFVVRRPILTN